MQGEVAQVQQKGPLSRLGHKGDHRCQRLTVAAACQCHPAATAEQHGEAALFIGFGLIHLPIVGRGTPNRKH
jgi:hypothetical protein